MEAQNIIETVQNIFIGADDKNWKLCLDTFADIVLFDYSSMTGQQAACLGKEEIVEGWKSFLPKFKATHHQLGNFMVNQHRNTAKIFFYGTASHYFPNPDGKNVWIVVGTYEAELLKDEVFWKVKSLKFNFKFADGNLQLPQMVEKERVLSN
jgi:hypothetical protein